MRGKIMCFVSAALVVALLGGPALAQRLYPGQPDWWAYFYDGDAAAPGGGFGALDGTWSHDNGSDQWDETPIGEGRPGGASALEEDGTTFLRMQDTGDPRDHAQADPGSNRKIMFGHSMADEVDADVAATVLDDGVTITFRARVPTAGLLDDIHPDGGGATSPYPETGDGYVPHDGGKDNFNVRQSDGDQLVSFALALASDDDELEASGLVMNKLNGTSPTGDVDLQGDEPGTVNILELDPTVWHEFWITIEADDSGQGTHVVNIFVDGSMEPATFFVTAGDGDDFDGSYIAMGVGATPQSGAIDVDFFAYRPGAVRPDGVFKAGNPDPPDGANAVQVGLFQWTPGADALLHDLYLGTDPNLDPNDRVLERNPMTLYFHPPGLVPGTTYYWRVDEIGADMTTVYTGDVWTFIAQPFTSYLPTPADGSNEAAPDPNLALMWLPGQLAVEHQVYFGGSFDDVNDGAAATDMGTTMETTYVLSDALTPLTAYYWRVDEIGATGDVERGEVWSFTTFSGIDDFESYTNEVGERPFEVWIDGIGFSLPEPGNNGNGTGSAVGHDIWDPNGPYFDGSLMETGNVHGGLQAMPVSYDNSIAPNYSEIERTWAAPQNWTAGGADAVVLYVRGAPDNDPEPMYVGIQDSVGNVGVVTQEASVVTAATWTQVTVPFDALTDAGVNMSAVAKVIVGLGDRSAPVPGGAGKIYLDDIRLVTTAAME